MNYYFIMRQQLARYNTIYYMRVTDYGVVSRLKS